MSLANPEFRPIAALGFDHVKSVQTIAWFVGKAGGSIEKLKLVKLLYLADRSSFARRGKPINFDSYFSLPHGPVPSTALNGVDHQFDDLAWEALSQADNKRDITVVGEVSEDRLSRADRKILDAVWDEFGDLTASQIRNWTHDHCAEYVEVGPDKSLPIAISDIMREVGRADPDGAARDVRLLQREVGALERMRAA